jgi:hypothetical protein
MIAVLRGTQRCIPSALLLLLLIVTLVMMPAPLAAQEPPIPPVPPVRDTLQVDTLQVDSLPPALPPVDNGPQPLVRYPAMPIGPAAGFSAGEWVWDREALLREAPTSLADLLERIPSVSTFRAGVYAQPEGAAAFGGTAGRMEIEVNGYVLDPLAAASFDLSQMPLVQIREVRIQRRLGLLRIRIFTDDAAAPDPYTRIEAGIGQPAANLFRGILLAPHVLVGPLGLAVERLDTEGMGAAEPSSVFSGWGAWSWTDGNRGVQVELLQSTVRRQPESPWIAHRTRRDVVVRARNTFAPGLVGEIYAGRGFVTDSLFPPAADTLAERFREITSTQAGARVVWDADVATVQGRIRYRDADILPRLEIGAEADGRLGPVRVGGEVSQATWQDADATLYYGLHGEVGLVLGTSVFGELTGGRRGAPPLRFGGENIFTERSGWRAGAAASILGGRATGGVAAFSLTQDLTWPFGLPFDTAGVAIAPGDARGIEAFGRLVIVPRWLAVESGISEWTESTGWVYVPVRSWRTALESHLVPLPSGNLEILGRLEVAQRSGALVYAAAVPTDPDRSPLEVVPSGTRIDGYLHVRVIDVRVFLRYEHFLGATQEFLHLPGRPLRGPRIFYGVKWNLWN